MDAQVTDGLVKVVDHRLKPVAHAFVQPQPLEGLPPLLDVQFHGGRSQAQASALLRAGEHAEQAAEAAVAAATFMGFVDHYQVERTQANPDGLL